MSVERETVEKIFHTLQRWVESDTSAANNYLRLCVVEDPANDTNLKKFFKAVEDISKCQPRKLLRNLLSDCPAKLLKNYGLDYVDAIKDFPPEVYRIKAVAKRSNMHFLITRGLITRDEAKLFVKLLQVSEETFPALSERDMRYIGGKAEVAMYLLNMLGDRRKTVSKQVASMPDSLANLKAGAEGDYLLFKFISDIYQQFMYTSMVIFPEYQQHLQKLKVTQGAENLEKLERVQETSKLFEKYDGREIAKKMQESVPELTDALMESVRRALSRVCGGTKLPQQSELADSYKKSLEEFLSKFSGVDRSKLPQEVQDYVNLVEQTSIICDLDASFTSNNHERLLLNGAINWVLSEAKSRSEKPKGAGAQEKIAADDYAIFKILFPFTKVSRSMMEQMQKR